MTGLPKCPECGQPLYPGATGKFPYGQIDPTDQGELRCVLLDDAGVLTLHFGKSVSWLAMRPHEARTLAAALIERADAMEGQ